MPYEDPTTVTVDRADASKDRRHQPDRKDRSSDLRARLREAQGFEAQEALLTEGLHDAAPVGASPGLARSGGWGSEADRAEELRNQRLITKELPMLEKMGMPFRYARDPEGGLFFQSLRMPAQVLTAEAFDSLARSVAEAEEQTPLPLIAWLVDLYPGWVMKNCHILPEERLASLAKHAPNRLAGLITERRAGGSSPAEGNWAAFGEAGSRARGPVSDGIDAMSWLLVAAAGVSLIAAFKARCLIDMALATVDLGFSIASLMPEAFAPAALTLSGAGPWQRYFIEKAYFTGSATFHRFCNAMGPSLTWQTREAIAANLTLA